jgi:hypothetical protein
MRAEQRRLKVANEKRAQDAREWEAARAEKQILDNLVDRLKGSEWEKWYYNFVSTIYLSWLCKLIFLIIFVEIGCGVNYIADEAHARYVQEKMATMELMEEDDDDTSRLSDLIALAEAGLHWEEEDDTSRLSELIALAEAGFRVQEEEDEFMSQATEEVEAAYYKQKCDEAEAKDELFSQAAYEAEDNYYKRTAEKCDAGQCSKWNEVVIEDCATDDSEDELLIDCDSDWTN